MALKIYIETTIPSFYFETRRDLDNIARRTWTRRWWDDHRHEHDLATSLVVRDELNSPAYPETKRRRSLALLDELPVLDVNAQIDEIVAACVLNLLMPQQPAADAIHLALASHYRCDVLLTWNCIHLANPNKFRHIEAINRRLSLPVPAVVTPLQLLGEPI